MNDFDFVFALFGLLLGFSLIEVLDGPAKVIELHLRAIKIGETAASERFWAGWSNALSHCENVCFCGSSMERDRIGLSRSFAMNVPEVPRSSGMPGIAFRGAPFARPNRTPSRCPMRSPEWHS